MQAPAESLARLEALPRKPLVFTCDVVGNRSINVRYEQRKRRGHQPDEWLVEMSHGPVVLREAWGDDGWEAARAKYDHRTKAYHLVGKWRLGDTAAEALWNC